MADLVGIVKELREGEKASFDSKAVVPVVLVKEVKTKGLVRRSQLVYGERGLTDEDRNFSRQLLRMGPDAQQASPAGEEREGES